MAKKKLIKSVKPRKPQTKSTVRNTVSRNPLLAKSHVHTESKKAKRVAAKKAIQKELDENG